MKKIPDGSVDMILTDLPYGTTRNKWDSIIPLDQLWGGYNRVIKENGAIVLFAQKPFDVVLGYSNLKNLKYEWIWQKTRPSGFLNVNRAPLKAHENILVFYKKQPTYNPQMRHGFEPYTRVQKVNAGSNYGRADGEVITINNGERYPIDVLTFKKETGYHPTQKPVPLLEYLIKTYTNEGETVLDSCMGSGSTGVACKNTNRNFIGIELNKEYYDIAKERMRE